MKNTIAAIILLLTVIILVIINAIAVARITDKLFSLTDEYEIDELKQYWDEQFTYLSISTNLKVMEDADKALVDLRSYHESGSVDEYLAAKERFINSVDEIATGEKILFYNIF
ncbi:MAG: hypothetical protein A2Y15_01805 [Clostridiales bacterium GWF2_36_10]|nr:MAG: hypothetical protein A2Y15_01805 [Clostridiales bacterium GWF2_36_10]